MVQREVWGEVTLNVCEILPIKRSSPWCLYPMLIFPLIRMSCFWSFPAFRIGLQSAWTSNYDAYDPSWFTWKPILQRSIFAWISETHLRCMNCLVCHHTSSQFLCKANDFDIHRCLNCLLDFTHPLPQETSVLNKYKHETPAERTTFNQFRKTLKCKIRLRTIKNSQNFTEKS